MKLSSLVKLNIFAAKVILPGGIYKPPIAIANEFNLNQTITHSNHTYYLDDSNKHPYIIRSIGNFNYSIECKLNHSPWNASLKKTNIDFKYSTADSRNCFVSGHVKYILDSVLSSSVTIQEIQGFFANLPDEQKKIIFQIINDCNRPLFLLQHEPKFYIAQNKQHLLPHFERNLLITAPEKKLLLTAPENDSNIID